MESDLHEKMVKRDKTLGAAVGGVAGGLAGHHLGGNSLIGGLAGALAGRHIGKRVGEERAEADKTKHERHIADREQAQQHRKDLINMKKEASTLEGVMLQAMADELSHIHSEKVAINLAPVGNFIAGLGSRAAAAAPQAITAMEGLGGHVVSGLEHAGRAITDAGAHGAGSALLGGLGHAEKALGGVQGLHRAAGAGALGLGALGVAGAAGAARRALAPQPTQITVR